MNNTNRQDFDKCTASVLYILYEKFPNEVDIIIEDLTEDKELNDNYFATMRFLRRENLIYYQELDFSNFKRTVLTAKSLSILDTTSDNINITLAQQLINPDKIAIIVQNIIKLAV
ncbi:MAG: hypothetical protein KAG43_05840 [Candidatus Marithrix sp.]|nr:hypothetical protein [Candidatus Marithrix sp.]